MTDELDSADLSWCLCREDIFEQSTQIEYLTLVPAVPLSSSELAGLSCPLYAMRRNVLLSGFHLVCSNMPSKVSNRSDLALSVECEGSTRRRIRGVEKLR